MDIFSTLVNACYNENPEFRLSSLYTIGFIFEELTKKLINEEYIKKFLFAIVFNFDKNFEEVLKVAINSFSKMVPFLGDVFSDKDLKRQLMENIYNLIDAEVIYHKLLLILNEIARYYYSKLDEIDFSKFFEFSLKCVRKFLLKN